MTSLYVTLYNSMGTAKKIAPLDTAGTCASYITSARGQGIGSVRFERGLEIKIPLIRAKKALRARYRYKKWPRSWFDRTCIANLPVLAYMVHRIYKYTKV